MGDTNLGKEPIRYARIVFSPGGFASLTRLDPYCAVVVRGGEIYVMRDDNEAALHLHPTPALVQTIHEATKHRPVSTLVIGVEKGYLPSEMAVLRAMPGTQGEEWPHTGTSRRESEGQAPPKKSGKKGLTLTDVMTFGKHKGVSVGLLIREHPDYIRWCLETFGDEFLSEDALAAYERNKARPKKQTVIR